MDLKAVGQRIKSAREAKNLTQEELAALVNLSPTHVSVIERGLKVTKLDTFKSHARGTGCISKFKSDACECNRERLESYKIGYLCCNCKCIRCFCRYSFD